VAKVRFGIVPADVRAKLGNVVYTRNRGGAVIRTRVNPLQTPTPNRTRVWNHWKTASTSWFTGLNDTKVRAWKNFAEQLNRTDQYGQRIRYDALRAYYAVNLRRLQLGLNVLALPPASTMVHGLRSLSVTVISGNPPTITITFTPSPLPAGHRLWIFASTSLQIGITQYQSYRRWIGASAAAITSPFNAAPLYNARWAPPFAGDGIGWKVHTVNEANGLMSPGIEFRAIVQ
jgi:hypothetical protein